MKSLLMRTIAAMALLAGAHAPAQATEGWYGRLDAGYSVDGELEFNDAGDGIELENDWMASGGLGYAFQNGFRAEGELAWRNNDLDEDVVDEGDVQVMSAMLNAYYDFNRGGRFEPYLGLGIGMAEVDTQLSAGGGLLTIDDSDNSYAYQGLAGVAIELTERLDLDIGYRYFVAPDLTYEASIDVGDDPVVGELDGEYTHQAVTVGLRWQFAAPAAPPPPAQPTAPPPAPPLPPVAVCPQSDFVVYFEWDRANLNQAALETIDSAVNQARACNVNAIAVVGHTDTSGATAYNAGLSERRASVVRDALTARGLPSGLISAQARGETDLARATRDGVREPLNRRTAVTISFR